MSDLVGNPEDRFSRVAAHIVPDWDINQINSGTTLAPSEALPLSETCHLTMWKQ